MNECERATSLIREVQTCILYRKFGVDFSSFLNQLFQATVRLDFFTLAGMLRSFGPLCDVFHDGYMFLAVRLA
jgi:hypothetical protein